MTEPAPHNADTTSAQLGTSCTATPNYHTDTDEPRHKCTCRNTLTYTAHMLFVPQLELVLLEEDAYSSLDARGRAAESTPGLIDYRQTVSVGLWLAGSLLISLSP